MNRHSHIHTTRSQGKGSHLHEAACAHIIQNDYNVVKALGWRGFLKDMDIWKITNSATMATTITTKHPNISRHFGINWMWWSYFSWCVYLSLPVCVRSSFLMFMNFRFNKLWRERCAVRASISHFTLYRARNSCQTLMNWCEFVVGGHLFRLGHVEIRNWFYSSVVFAFEYLKS